LSSVANAHYQNIYINRNVIELPPSGSVTLGGVPFVIEAEGANCWSSAIKNSGLVSIDIAIGEYGVKNVDTLMNSLWGRVGPKTRVEFFGSNDAYYSKDLVGNSDIRDFFNNVYTNSINGTTTTRVWYSDTASGGRCRMDKQFIELPRVFEMETLDFIRISDWGSQDNHRAFITGLTLELDPCNAWKGGAPDSPTDWGDSANWNLGSLPDGVGAKVGFGNQPAVNSAIELGSKSRTVGTLVFSGLTSASIQSSEGYSLHLNNDGSISQIDVAGNHVISAPVIIDNDAEITGSGTLHLSSGISGNYSLTVLGNCTAKSIDVDTLIIGSGAGASQAVPEPPSLILLALSALAALSWHRTFRVR
jgi:hypothetical protein